MTFVTTEAPRAASEMEYGGVPPLTVNPHDAHVLSELVTFDVTENVDEPVDGMHEAELPAVWRLTATARSEKYEETLTFNCVHDIGEPAIVPTSIYYGNQQLGAYQRIRVSPRSCGTQKRKQARTHPVHVGPATPGSTCPCQGPGTWGTSLPQMRASSKARCQSP